MEFVPANNKPNVTMDDLIDLVLDMDASKRLRIRLMADLYSVSLATPADAMDFFAKMKEREGDWSRLVAEARLMPENGGITYGKAIIEIL